MIYFEEDRTSNVKTGPYNRSSIAAWSVFAKIIVKLKLVYFLKHEVAKTNENLQKGPMLYRPF